MIIQGAPRSERFQQDLAILRCNRFIETALMCRLGKKLREIPLEIGLDFADALGSATERAGSVQKRIVIELNERLDRDIEALAVIEHRTMMIGNSPGPGVEIKPLLELTGLGGSSGLGKAVA